MNVMHPIDWRRKLIEDSLYKAAQHYRDTMDPDGSKGLSIHAVWDDPEMPCHLQGYDVGVLCGMPGDQTLSLDISFPMPISI